MTSKWPVKRRLPKRMKRALCAAVCLFIVLQVMLLWWLFSSSEPQSLNPLPVDEEEVYLLRPDGRGGEVRVMAVVVSTHITDELCINVASAYMSGLPTVVIGYHYQDFRLLSKIDIVLNTLVESGLSDEDVLIFSDSDAFFTGMDPLPYIDRFIAESAASPREVDPRAVREGRKSAPLVVSSGSNCYSLHFYRNQNSCAVDYDPMINASKTYAEEHGMVLAPRVRSHLNKMRYLNSGAVVARVWALREVYQAIVNYTKKHTPDLQNTWVSDQSVLVHLYKDLRYWEMNSGALITNDPAQRQDMRSSNGLRAGIIQLDEFQELAALFVTKAHKHYQMTNERWPAAKMNGVLTYDFPSWIDELGKMFRKMFLGQYFYPIDDEYIRRVYQQSGGPASFTKRRVHGGSGVIDIAPPLLSLKPRYGVDIVDDVTHRVFPIMVHMAGPQKERRVRDALPFAQWYLPMMFNDDSRRLAEKFLSDKYMQLLPSTNHSRVLLRSVCGESLLNIKITI